MDKFTIPCTKEQAERAYKLGAPIQKKPTSYYTICPQPGTDYEEEFTEESDELVIPTAAQMLGWFRSKNIHVVIHKDFIDKWSAYAHEIEPVEFTVFHGLTGYNSFEEVTLAAIDAALKYLENK